MNELIDVKKMDMLEAKKHLDAGEDIVLLDVRSKLEYREGYIKGAINIPVNELKDRIEEIVPDKAQTIYLYCRSGVRTIMAGDTLLELGYTSIYDMGGIIYWPYEVVK